MLFKYRLTFLRTPTSLFIEGYLGNYQSVFSILGFGPKEITREKKLRTFHHQSGALKEHANAFVWSDISSRLWSNLQHLPHNVPTIQISHQTPHHFLHFPFVIISDLIVGVFFKNKRKIKIYCRKTVLKRNKPRQPSPNSSLKRFRNGKSCLKVPMSCSPHIHSV